MVSERSKIKGDFKCYVEIRLGKDIIHRSGGKNWLGRGENVEIVEQRKIKLHI